MIRTHEVWSQWRGTVAVAMVLVALGGCVSRDALQASPSTLTRAAENGEAIFPDIPPDQRVNTIELVVVTDRTPVPDPELGTALQQTRDHDMHFGVARVGVGPGMTWDEMVTLSVTEPEEVRLELLGLELTGTFPLSYRRSGDGEPHHPRYLNLPEEVVSLQGFDEFRSLMESRLASSSRKAVFIYVQGANANFDWAAFDLAQIWHYLGRPGVPIMYAWPAKSPGAFFYASDRESSEFTVGHFKILLSALSQIPDVEEVHIMAYSRGVGLVADAMRELHIWHTARGLPTAERLKVRNTVIFAGDLDADVAGERLSEEGVLDAFGHLTLYFSEADSALNLSSWLQGSRGRLGAIGVHMLDEVDAQFFRDYQDRLTAVNFPMRDVPDHAYFRHSPELGSDIVLLLGEGRMPGAENGRPLKFEPEAHIWSLFPGYPLEPPPADTRSASP